MDNVRLDAFEVFFNLKICDGIIKWVNRSAHLFLKEVREEIDKIGIGEVATVFGRADCVRKDGYEHQTDRVVGALSGDLAMFVDGTHKMSGKGAAILTSLDEEMRIRTIIEREL